MGLHDEITADMVEAFDTDLADAVSSLTYTVITRTIDTSTNKNVDTPVNHLTRGVLSPFKSQELAVSGGSILSTDMKCLILQDELPGVTPVIADEINGLKILDVKSDPAAVTWTIQLRVSGK